MKKLVTWMAWVSLVVVAALAALNWPALLVASRIDFLVTELTLPVGLLMLALAAVPLVLLFVAHLHQQIGTLLETRRLFREVQRAHELADKAEASRIEGLRQLMTDQFRVIQERLDSLGAAQPVGADPPARPSGMRRLIHGPWKREASIAE